MNRLILLFYLKMADVLKMRLLLLMIIFLPLLLGMLAGQANLANREPDIRIGVVDLETSKASRALITALQDKGWQIDPVNQPDARHLLLRQAVDGILTIPPGYTQALATLAPESLSYMPAEGSLVTDIVREAISAVVFPEHSRLSMLQQLENRYRALDRIMPDDLPERFAASMSEYATREARLDIIYMGSVTHPPRLTDVVSDYTVEVLFLSVFAVLAMLGLTGQTLQQRLAATRGGLLLDYLVSLVVLQLIGCLQILLYTTAMSSAMDMQIQAKEGLLLAVFLYFMIGLGQLMSLLHKDLRVYLSLMLLAAMAVAGGCFFPLPRTLFLGFAQYLPHGWVLGAISGYPVLPAAVPLLLGTLLIIAGYFIRSYRVRHHNE